MCILFKQTHTSKFCIRATKKIKIALNIFVVITYGSIFLQLSFSFIFGAFSTK